MVNISKWSAHKEALIKLCVENPNKQSKAITTLFLGHANGESKNYRSLNSYILRHLHKWRQQYEGFEQAADDNQIPITSQKHIWFKDKNHSVFAKNPHYLDEKELDYNKIQRKIIKDLQNYSPTITPIERKHCDNSHLLVIDPADVHIGKLCTIIETGDHYNSDIAYQRVISGVEGILQKTQHLNIDKILFVAGNDILHVDNSKNTTTKGTPQDTVGMWHENFIIAKNLYVEVIEKLLSVADVHFVYNPSNHDYVSGYFLANIIETHFRNCVNATFDCSLRHRKAFRYHSNLIGTTHGDGAKWQDLPLLMAQEYAKEWGETKHRYIYSHHVHHKMAKDFVGVTVESLRSPSGADGWHSRSGYQHAPKAIEGFVHDKEHGQIARITHIF